MAQYLYIKLTKILYVFIFSYVHMYINKYTHSTFWRMHIDKTMSKGRKAEVGKIG